MIAHTTVQGLTFDESNDSLILDQIKEFDERVANLLGPQFIQPLQDRDYLQNVDDGIFTLRDICTKVI